MIHLDANFLVTSLVPGSSEESPIVGWLSAGESLGMCSVAWGEFLCGPLSPTAEALASRLLTTVESLTRVDAEKAA